MTQFPYKRNYLNPDVLWQNVLDKDYTQIKEIKTPYHWTSLNRVYRWHYVGLPKFTTLGIITDIDSYEEANVLSDYFTEDARIRANIKGRPSPLQYFNDNYNELISKTDDIFKLRETIFIECKECTNFKISIAKAIVKYFNARNVLDPSAGWGDRLFGVTAAGANYLGIDPNPNLREPYRNIIKFIKNDIKGKASFISGDFLKVDIKGKFDLVLTSPPFYDYEVYNKEDKNQSITNINSVEEWIEKFLTPYLIKAYNLLRRGGKMVLYLQDTSAGNYTVEMGNILKKQGARLLGVMAFIIKSGDYGRPIFVFEKR